MVAAHVMPTADSLVGAAEAAFIANLDPKELHRVVDESVLPADLMQRAVEARKFARLGAALARFYFDTADELSKAMRVEVMSRLMDRLRTRDNLGAILSLAGPLSSIDWSFRSGYLTVDLRDAIEQAAVRAARASNALRLVVEDTEVMGGKPTFRGTRVPIDVAVGAPTAGAAFIRLQESYPFLTVDHVDAATVYSVIRPRRGRPAGTTPPGSAWKVKSSRRLPPTNP
jgi:uncharacterized protein (DUF433 family)